MERYSVGYSDSEEARDVGEGIFEKALLRFLRDVSGDTHIGEGRNRI